MPELSRTLLVYADNQSVTGFRHARLTGTDAIGLYPLPFTLRLWNLSDSDYNLLLSAKKVSVMHNDSVLAAGTVSDHYKSNDGEDVVTEIVFSAGLPLWEAEVNLSVESGVSVSETVRKILDASGTGVTLLSFPGEDPVRFRGQAFFGRAAECIASVLTAARARSCLMPAGLCVIPASGLPVSMTLTDRDLLDAPVKVGGLLAVLRTTVTGWPVGKMISVTWKGETLQGLVVERSVDADNVEGNWQSELLVEKASVLLRCM